MHDWGGMIGMGLAARHPKRIGRLVLMNTAAFHLPRDMRLPLALRAIRSTALGAVAVRGFNAFSRTAAHVGAKRPKLTRELRQAYCAPYHSWASRIATLRFVQDIPVQPRDPSYETVSQTERALPAFVHTPSMFAWGMKDFVFTPQVLGEWRKRWPDAEVHTFADCGHYVLEDAAYEVCGLVKTFLARHPV
jgi:haloalkane dehalogenase